MWKYTHTDEMYHSLVNRNSSTELFHSDVYLGQEFSDGLKHYKYLKRERKNGKWVYYYSNEEYNAALKKKAQADAAYKKSADKYKELDDQYTRAENSVTLARLSRDIHEGFNKNKKGLINKIKYNVKQKELKENVKKANAERFKTAEKKMKAFSDYADKGMESVYADNEAKRVEKKTKVHRAVGKTLAKAANKLSDASYNTKKAVEKGKKKVIKTLKKMDIYNDKHRIENHAMTNFNYVNDTKKNDTKKNNTNKVDDTKKKKKKKSVPRTYLVNK